MFPPRLAPGPDMLPHDVIGRGDWSTQYSEEQTSKQTTEGFAHIC